MLPLGTEAPDFSLIDAVSGDKVTLADFADKDALLVVFLSNHCPYVQHVRAGLAQFSADYANRGLGIVGICSNDPEAYPDDSPEKMKAEAETHGYRFPYLVDDDQSVAIAYRAMCTPDFFLFDGDRKLVYRGRFDESRPSSDVPVTGRDLRDAADAALAGDDPLEQQIPSMGCSIKWKPGNTPAYFQGA